MKNNNLTKLDAVTKILVILLVVAVSYFVIFLVLRPFFITQPSNMMDMMNQIVSRGIRTENILPLIIALIIGVIISFYLFKQTSKGDEYNILRKALSEDEKKILNEIK